MKNRSFASGLLWLMALATGVALVPARAQSPDPKTDGAIVLELKGGEKSEDVSRMVDTLRRDGRSVTVRFADRAAASSAPTETAKPAPAATSTAPQPGPKPQPASEWGAFVDSLVAALSASRMLLGNIPKLGPDLARATADPAYSAVGWLILTLAFAASLGLARGVHQLIWKALALHERHCTARTLSRMALSLRRLIADVAAAGSGLIALKLIVDWWDPSSKLIEAGADSLLRALATAAAYIIIGRFLLSPGQPAARLLRLPRAELHFRLLLIYVGAGQTIFNLLATAGAIASDMASVGGLYLITSTAITIFKIWWFWMARHDIEALIIGASRDPENAHIGMRILAVATPWLYILATTLIWLIARVAVMMPEGARWAAAAGLTQFIIVLAPIGAIGASHMIRDLHVVTPEGVEPSPLRRAFGVVAEKAAGGAVWLVALFVLARMWGDFFMESGSQVIMTQVRNIAVVAEILVIGYLLWVFFHTLFEAHAPKHVSALPSEDDEAHDQVQTRLGSVLPILRGFSLGAIFGLTLLVALSKLGVDIGPLLAGFGILGLAISFGSQALVRDIVSGLFFMMEDAFRVGEYIDTGRLRGTVEKISLRSVQLRHQSGQIHTVPFGQISAVTNASRDWATVKFNIKLDPATDIEKARKAIKKTGIAMMEDPEIGRDFILPLKMQGVSDILETGIVLRLKFTAKPSQASYLQRESLKRVHRALNEAGVQFASNAVTVMRNIDDMAAAAASITLSQRAANAPAA
ncbi:mechanosensitive ion channel family protein [Terrarubrum flagellatum]|uniref:mechanosensitive ion channel family protein n=1 Tax=Terrirubrum flagellatum TaxID=2895980 RepID=UPI0031451C0E